MVPVVMGLALLTSCHKVVAPGHVGIVVKQSGTDRGVQDFPVQMGRVWFNPINEVVLTYPTYVQHAIWTSSTQEEMRPGSSQRVVGKSLSPQLMRWKQLEILDQKWNGQFPQVVRNGTLPLLQLGKERRQSCRQGPSDPFRHDGGCAVNSVVVWARSSGG